jgi:hypothetical protein
LKNARAYKNKGGGFFFGRGVDYDLQDIEAEDNAGRGIEVEGEREDPPSDESEPKS